jgi:hypothetical protein
MGNETITFNSKENRDSFLEKNSTEGFIEHGAVNYSSCEQKHVYFDTDKVKDATALRVAAELRNGHITNS